MFNYLRGISMKKMLFILITCATLSACGTIGGTLGGAGDDMKRAGEWVKSR
jgi:predicted small secreted protein